MFSFQLPFLYFPRLLIETNRFLQMHFNLNIPSFIFNLGHFTISSSTRFPRVPPVYIQLCMPCLHCKPPIKFRVRYLRAMVETRKRSFWYDKKDLLAVLRPKSEGNYTLILFCTYKGCQKHVVRLKNWLSLCSFDDISANL